jgi:hypothetical protein
MTSRRIEWALIGLITALALASSASGAPEAWIEAEGQSNVVGYKSVNATDPPQAFKNFATAGTIPIMQLDEQSGGGTLNTIYVWRDFAICKGASLCATTQDGEWMTKVTGYGERTIGTADGAFPLNMHAYGSSLTGIAVASDIGGYLAGAGSLKFFKVSDPGKPLDDFRPWASYTRGGGKQWGNLRTARVFLRAYIANSPVPIYDQFKIWWQGEANTNASRLAGSIQPDLANYAANWLDVYNYDLAQYGDSPDWFIVQPVQIKASNRSSDVDPYVLYLDAQLQSLCRWTVTLGKDGSLISVVDSGNGAAANRYYVVHPFIDCPNCLHITAGEQFLLGKGLTALATYINGGSGLSTAHLLTQVLPQFQVYPTLIGTTSTGGDFRFRPAETSTLYWLVQPAGSPAPTSAEIIAANHSQPVTYKAGPSTFASVVTTGGVSQTSYDAYFVLRENVFGQTTAVGPPVTFTTN